MKGISVNKEKFHPPPLKVSAWFGKGRDEGFNIFIQNFKDLAFKLRKS